MTKKSMKNIRLIATAVVVTSLVAIAVTAFYVTDGFGIATTEEIIAYSVGSSWLDRHTFKSVLIYGGGMGQSFVPTKDAVLSKIIIPLKRSADSPSGSCRVRVRDSLINVAYSAQPQDSYLVAISGSIDTSHSFITFTFPKDTYPTTLTAGETYYIILTHSWTGGTITGRGYRMPQSGGGWSYKSTNSVWSSSYEFIRYEVYGITTGGANNAPTTPTLAGSSSLYVGTTGSWTAAATDPDAGDQIRYVWQVDGITVRTSGWKTSGVSDSLSRSFLLAGSYTISVKAEDTEGLSSGWATQTVQVVQEAPQNQAPSVPIITGTESMDVGAAGSWSARSTDPDGDNIKYTWTVDGIVARTSGYMSSGASDSLTHTFSSAGQHIISVTATDVGGRTSSPATKYVQVGGVTPSGYTLTVSVFDDSTNGLIEGATVIIGSDSETTTSTGTVTFTLESGTYIVSASKSGYAVDVKTVIIANADDDLAFYLVPTDGAPGVPGFEILAFIVAIGITGILLKRRRKK